MTRPTNVVNLPVTGRFTKDSHPGAVGTGGVAVAALPQQLIPISCANAKHFLNLQYNFIDVLTSNGFSLKVLLDGVPHEFPAGVTTAAVLDHLGTKFITGEAMPGFYAFEHQDIVTRRFSVVTSADNIATLPGFTTSLLQQIFNGLSYNPTFTLVDEDEVGFAVCMGSAVPQMDWPQDADNSGIITFLEFDTPVAVRMLLLPGNRTGDGWVMRVTGTGLNTPVDATGTLTTQDVLNGYVTILVTTALSTSVQSLAVTGHYTRGDAISVSGGSSVSLGPQLLVGTATVSFPQDVNNDGYITPLEYAGPTIVRFTVPSGLVVGDTWQLMSDGAPTVNGVLTQLQIDAGFVTVSLPIAANIIPPTYVPPQQSPAAPLPDPPDLPAVVIPADTQATSIVHLGTDSGMVEARLTIPSVMMVGDEWEFSMGGITTIEAVASEIAQTWTGTINEMDKVLGHISVNVFVEIDTAWTWVGGFTRGTYGLISAGYAGTVVY